jgi:hypothetical protein
MATTLASAAPAPMVLGTNWFRMAFNGIDPNATGVTQNADGSISIAGGGGDHYNAQLVRHGLRTTLWASRGRRSAGAGTLRLP